MARGFEPGRLFGLDVARGVALFGMFAAHVLPRQGERVVDGRSAILFAVVAGASIGLLTGAAPASPAGAGASPPLDRGAARLVVVRRGLLLIVIGVLLALLQPPIAVILDAYGFGFLLLVPLLFAPPPALAAVAAGVAIAGPLVVGAATGMADVDELPLPLQPFAWWVTHGAYPMALWLAYLLAGLAAARAGLDRVPVRVALLLGGTTAAVTGYGAAALIPGATAAAHSDTAFEAFGSGGVALALIGGALLLADAPGLLGTGVRLLLWPVAAAGAMALTLYAAHAVVLAGIRAAAGDRFPPLDDPGWLLPALIGGALVAASLWRAFLGRGPLEAAMRAISFMGARRPSAGAAEGPRVTP